jgi:hypothetical protein
MGRIKTLALGICVLLTLAACASSVAPEKPSALADDATGGHRQVQLIYVKYRTTPVDVIGFQYLDTSGSSLVTGAWYDQRHEYMVVGLHGIYYHYCRMPQTEWDAFRSAASFGRHYNARIKGNFDCRLGGIPE